MELLSGSDSLIQTILPPLFGRVSDDDECPGNEYTESGSVRFMAECLDLSLRDLNSLICRLVFLDNSSCRLGCPFHDRRTTLTMNLFTVSRISLRCLEIDTSKLTTLT